MKKTLKQKYLSSALLLLVSTAIVKVISAFYKIPLTSYIGAEGRGYFSVAYNLCMPVHALIMGAFPLGVTKLTAAYNAKGDVNSIKAIRAASKRLFLIIGILGLGIMLIVAKPYCELISSSPKSIFTVLALVPSLFFCCLCACHRAFCEGFLDMKATAVSQLIEALFKMIFGLLFARYSMSYLYENYIITGTVMGISVGDDAQALCTIYPITSAFAMLGVTLGSICAYIFAAIYSSTKYNDYSRDGVGIRHAYSELLSFSAPLVGATVIQSLSNFIDTSGMQYFLTRCNGNELSVLYGYNGDDIYTYVLGIFAAVLDFRNLVPSIVMVLGVTAVPAISSAYESDSERFSSLLTSIFKYSSALSIAGGLVLSLFSREILSIFYYSSNYDIVQYGSKILFQMGTMILPCSLATTTVYCTQALGLAKSTIPSFVISCIIRVVLNCVLIKNINVNISGAVFSAFFGFAIIVVMNVLTIRHKTGAKISVSQVLLKPVFCGGVTYFLFDFIRERANLTIVGIFALIISCVLFFLIMLLITKTIDIKLLNQPK